MHIGTARVALFNWLYARHHGGAYLLRIEDTDRERSTEAAVQVILDGLNWLGLNPDAPPVFQFARADRHREVVQRLLEIGRAYRCYMTVEELSAEREKARAEGRAIRSPWRDRQPPAGENRPFVIRFKGPLGGETLVDDLVKGPVTFRNKELDDLVLLRSDGAPTYNLAVVVDDHDMGITHVIRGDDHLTNTFRQIQVYRAMGWVLPEFAHIPLIHGPDGKKLSKRHGAQFALEFRDDGFLPEALCNYLMRLGWSHGDLEIIGREDAIRLFDIVDVNRGASRMDYAKLMNLNGIYIRQANDDRLTSDVMERLAHREGLSLGSHAAARIRTLMPALKERAKTMVELADSAAFLARSVPLPMDPKAAAALTPEAQAMLRQIGAALAGTDFSVPAIDAALRGFAERNGLKLGQVAQPLRAALTGSSVSPGIDATLAALGRQESLARIVAATT